MGCMCAIYYDLSRAHASLIFPQPFNAGYIWKNTSDNEIIPNPSITVLNSYIGGVEQQATSGVTTTNQGCYEGETGCFAVYGFEVRSCHDICSFIG